MNDLVVLIGLTLFSAIVVFGIMYLLDYPHD